jgi:hypothetical protein
MHKMFCRKGQTGLEYMMMVVVILMLVVGIFVWLKTTEPPIREEAAGLNQTAMDITDWGEKVVDTKEDGIGRIWYFLDEHFDGAYDTVSHGSYSGEWDGNGGDIIVLTWSYREFPGLFTDGRCAGHVIHITETDDPDAAEFRGWYALTDAYKKQGSKWVIWDGGCGAIGLDATTNFRWTQGAEGDPNSNWDHELWECCELGLPGVACDGDVKDDSEVCDGSDLGGQTCGGRGYNGGTLACAADCLSLDESGCYYSGQFSWAYDETSSGYTADDDYVWGLDPARCGGSPLGCIERRVDITQSFTTRVGLVTPAEITGGSPYIIVGFAKDYLGNPAIWNGQVFPILSKRELYSPPQAWSPKSVRVSWNYRLYGPGSVIEVCGDNIVQTPNYPGFREECDLTTDTKDEGATMDCEGQCRADCTCPPPPPTCGNGDPTDPGEDCDGGTPWNPATADADCPSSRCVESGYISECECEPIGNQPPVADGGGDRTLPMGIQTISGTCSNDPDGDDIDNCWWYPINVPAGCGTGTGTESPGNPAPSKTATLGVNCAWPETITIELRGWDPYGAVGTDRITVTFT